MATIIERKDIIAEADLRYPTYTSLSQFNLSGGFITGATYALQNPSDARTSSDIALEKEPVDKDALMELKVNGLRREGFERGVDWIRELKKTDG